MTVTSQHYPFISLVWLHYVDLNVCNLRPKS